MDRDLSSKHMQRQKLKMSLKIGSVVIVIIFSLVAFRAILKPTIKRSMMRTAIAETGSIEASITASGIVVPEFEQVITSPIQSKIIRVDRTAGEHIKKGESLLQLDQEFVRLAYDKLKDEHELKKNKETQLRLNLERRLIDLQAEFDIKILKIKSLEEKVELQKRIFEIGAGTEEALNEAKLNLEIARRERDQMQGKIANQEESLHADLKELNLQIKIQGKNMSKLNRQLELAEARADRDGVITWINEDIGAAVNPGDVIARIADLGSFKVEATISDIHAAKLIVGNPVKVRFNNVDLSGKISSIRPTIQNGIITFIVHLDDKTNELLRSNLRVDISVITAFKDNVVRAENGPFVNGSGQQDIFVIEGDLAIRKTVIIGATNFDYVEIQNNVNPGNEIIINDMEDYIHLKHIEIKN